MYRGDIFYTLEGNWLSDRIQQTFGHIYPVLCLAAYLQEQKAKEKQLFSPLVHERIFRKKTINGKPKHFTLKFTGFYCLDRDNNDLG